MKSLFISLLFFEVSRAEESFIVVPKSSNAKPAATSALGVKEDFVYCVGDLLRQIAELQEQLGRLQKKLLEDVMDVVEGTSNGLFAKEKKLSGKQKMVEAVRAIERKIEELNSILKKF